MKAKYSRASVSHPSIRNHPNSTSSSLKMIRYPVNELNRDEWESEMGRRCFNDSSSFWLSSIGRQLSVQKIHHFQRIFFRTQPFNSMIDKLIVIEGKVRMIKKKTKNEIRIRNSSFSWVEYIRQFHISSSISELKGTQNSLQWLWKIINGNLNKRITFLCLFKWYLLFHMGFHA